MKDIAGQWLVWRKAGWLLSCLTALAGLSCMAYIAWLTRHGEPRGPAETIAAGFILYAGLVFRFIAGPGLLLFKPASKRATLAIVIWAVEMSALWWFELPPYSWMARVYFLIWCGGALSCDLWLLSMLRAQHGSTPKG